MNRSRITGAILLRWDDCTSILSKHLTTLLQRPIQLCHMVEDYDYWCIALKTGRFSIPESSCSAGCDFRNHDRLSGSDPG